MVSLFCRLAASLRRVRRSARALGAEARAWGTLSLRIIGRRTGTQRSAILGNLENGWYAHKVTPPVS
jgi:hypothetical protein